MTRYLKYLAVMEPGSLHQTALTKAITLADKTNASITAFVCAYLSADEINHYPSRQEGKHLVLNKLGKWVSSQVTSHIKPRVEVSTEVTWNSDWPSAVSHYAKQINANLIIQSGGDGGIPQRKLLRSAPCPVLVARATTHIFGGMILAAVDIHGDDTHMALNHAIITAALNLAEDTNSTLHLVCALDEKEAVASHLGFEYLEDTNTQQAITAERFGIPQDQVHIQLGNPHVVISEWVNILAVDVLVIGTQARKGIEGTLIGNTAEKMLTKTGCDLLVVN